MTKQTQIILGSGAAVVVAALYFKQQQFNQIDADASDAGIGPSPSAFQSWWDAMSSGEQTGVELFAGSAGVLLGLLIIAVIIKDVV